jgi:hypothetical protein
MTDKGKETDAATKAKFAQKFPALVRNIAKTAGGAQEQADQFGAKADAIFAGYAPQE